MCHEIVAALGSSLEQGYSKSTLLTWITSVVGGAKVEFAWVEIRCWAAPVVFRL